MRTARAKVVKGKIVTKAKYPDGTKLTLVPDCPQPEIALDDEDLAAIDEAVKAAKSGKLIPLEVVRALMRRM